MKLIDSIGVHISHCCARHGCKYAYTGEVCPVVAGTHRSDDILQCEICYQITQELRDLIVNVPNGVELLRKDNVHEEWVVYTAMGAIPLVFYFNGQVVINTAPYSPATVEWIHAKAKLNEIMGAIR